MHQKISVLGVEVSQLNQQTVVPEILKLVMSKKSVHIVTPNPEHIVQAQEDIAFKTALNQADIAIPDGIGLVWAMKRKSSAQKIERVTGVDLMLELCKVAEEKGWIVGLLGGASGVAKQTKQCLLDQLPSLKVIVLPYNIAFSDKDLNKQLAQKIAAKHIDVLFVALGAPKQELFISKYINYMSTLKIAMGVGGAFDVISGRLKRPPVWLQRLGLEWLFRLYQEPWRWKRQTRLVEFVWRVLLSK
ncbi:WecB/TagA/CpsF family glycosyltransferase [Candidatus Beckwithbacteria bacterium]|nr:WecB/TagA/CpsF family glycosyltransferase [Candidatus Beckwithbacteria bacterium]